MARLFSLLVFAMFTCVAARALQGRSLIEALLLSPDQKMIAANDGSFKTPLLNFRDHRTHGRADTLPTGRLSVAGPTVMALAPSGNVRALWNPVFGMEAHLWVAGTLEWRTAAPNHNYWQEAFAFDANSKSGLSLSRTGLRQLEAKTGRLMLDHRFANPVAMDSAALSPLAGLYAYGGSGAGGVG